jgi:hypothetical protein
MMIMAVVDNDNDKIRTPYDTAKTKFNYGPASYRDDIVVTCERPGGDPIGGTKKIPLVTALEAWRPYVQDEKSVRHVLILLDDNELEQYDGGDLVDAYERVGLTVHWEPLSKPASFQRIMSILDECYTKKERVAAHCTKGQGRSGRVAAGWLVHRYSLTPETATLEVLATATTHGVSRLGSVVELVKWMNR